VNRIALGSDTPLSFILSILVDNSNMEHNAVNRITARGQTATGDPVEPDVSPEMTEASFNGKADLYRLVLWSVGFFTKI
jgi:hypothetical protein